MNNEETSQTVQQTVAKDPCEPLPPETGPWRLAVPRWLRIFGTVAFGLSVIMIISSFIKLDYIALSPGQAYETETMIKINGATTHSHKGELYMTTVSVSHLTVLGWVVAKIDRNAEIVPAGQINGSHSDEEVDRLNKALMKASKMNATVVALEKLGYSVQRTGDGAIVAEVSKEVPANGLLEAGDLIVEIDGQPVHLVTDLTTALEGTKPGETASLIIDRGGKRETVDVPLIKNPRDPSKGMIGIIAQTKDLRIQSDIKVTIDSLDVGGPSAGLVYTLTIIQDLTKVDITKGHRVAATGEMNLDGTVGAIGGVEQKVRSVEKAGADIFLVPDANCAAARQAATDVKVACVNNINEALAALGTLPGAA